MRAIKIKYPDPFLAGNVQALFLAIRYYIEIMGEVHAAIDQLHLPVVPGVFRLFIGIHFHTTAISIFIAATVKRYNNQLKPAGRSLNPAHTMNGWFMVQFYR